MKIIEGKRHLHFIGIGGSGMFPIVQILHSMGCFITGSDNNEGDTVDAVRKMGITVYMGQRAENIEGADLVVYSAAIMKTNPELRMALDSGIETVERSVMLGCITAEFDRAICVSGTHGKTTTTSMITQILMMNKLDPTTVIGGKLPLIGGSGRLGKSDIMVCESCEFVDTFLKLHPDIAVILNVDADHLEYFKNIENIKNSFTTFASMATKAVVYNGDDSNTCEVISRLKDKKTVSFGYDIRNNYSAQNITVSNGETEHERLTVYDLYCDGEYRCEIRLNIPGRHNVLNSLASVAACEIVGIAPKQSAEAILSFHGANRRFQILGTVNGITVADDYAHHPAELTVTLNAAMSMGYKKVWAIFQPFTFSRTKILLDDFAKALSIPDKVVITEIMGAREINTFNIYSKDLAVKVPGSVIVDGFRNVADYILEHAESGDLVITLGCGDIYKAAKLMLKSAKKDTN